MSKSVYLNEDLANISVLSGDSKYERGERRKRCFADMLQARDFLDRYGKPQSRFVEKKLHKYVCFTICDWAIACAAIYFCSISSIICAPVFLLIIGSRQRALGNILHDFAHRGFSSGLGLEKMKVAKLADGFAEYAIALPLFTTMRGYRASHIAHHLYCGSPEADPDYINDPELLNGPSWLVFARFVMKFDIFSGSMFGRILVESTKGRAIIAFWWVFFIGVISAMTSVAYGFFFFAIWMIARMTSFHLITTFREMADHVGLNPGGILSFTRNSPSKGLLKSIIHPHENGFHITHHLFPSAPFYALPILDSMLAQWPAYAEAEHCSSYFLSDKSFECVLRTSVFASFTSVGSHKGVVKQGL